MKHIIRIIKLIISLLVFNKVKQLDRRILKINA